MCWVLLPASYAEMPTSAEVKASGENTAPPAENENETRTADSAENKAEDNMIPTAGDVFSNEEGKELTASETQIGEDTEEVLATREPVEVRFVLEPAETVLTVYDPAQLDEQGCSRIISPEKEGNYLLFSGTYLIDAVCDGCIPILQQTVKISPDLWEIPIVLTRMEESAENKAPEEEREVMFEEMKSASEVTAVPGESVLQATIPHEEKQTDREIAENPADGEKEENEIQPAAISPLIVTVQPTDYVGKIGENATFTVVAEGDGIKYQWQVKTSDNAAWKNTTIYGYRTAKATVPITAARNNYQYRCVLTQEGIEETTEAARLTVIPAVRITQQPEDQAGFIGENATFSVAAEGEGIRYQWQVKSSEKAAWKNTTIRGYQTAMITVPIAKERDGFQYRCLLTGEEGIRVTSNSAQLTIAEIPYCAPMLTIIDDDGDYHFMTDVLPLIQELQVPIATAVTPLRIGSKTRWMSWDDIAYCAANGAEVLCHTYSHYSGSEIVNIDDETIVRQYGLARDCMIERGYNGDILVYSSSTGNIQRVREDAAQVFQCGIKIGGNSVNNRLTDRYALNRCRIDYAETEGKTSWNRDDILQYIDDVAEQGGWQIFMFHTSNSMWRQRALLDENGEVVRGENGAPIPMTDKDGNPVLDSRGEHPTMGTEYYLPMLREAILYARERGVAILTAENAYRILYSEE